MKKILLLSSAIICSASSFAQLDTIKNHSFETWSAGEPVGWGSSNAVASGSVAQAVGGDVLGTNTLVLTTKSVLGNSMSGVVVSGGTYTVSGATSVVKGGIPLRMRPLKLNYVCKYTSGGGSDAPLVQVVLTRWNATAKRRDTLGISRSSAAGTTYAKQSLTLSYDKNPAGGNPTTIKNYLAGSASPDTVQLSIYSSKPGVAVANSTFYIDSLSFEYFCDLNPKITTTGNLALTLPDDGDTITAEAGKPFSLNVTSYIPKTVTMNVPGIPIPLTTTIDSVMSDGSTLSGSASTFLTVDANPTNGKTGGNSVNCVSISGTIPASPANAIYNLILTPIMWGTSAVAPLTSFPSPQTVTITIKVGNGGAKITNTDNNKWGTMKFNGNNRVYNVYVPSVYDGSKPVPLLFNIHGWTGSSTKQRDFANFMPIADTANFIVVSPQALGDVPSWDLTGTSDTDFLMALLDTLESEYNIDTNRVYSTGFSQGGMMSFIFACFHSTKIAAVAPVAGGMSQTNLGKCNPAHYMPLMEIHGDADILASYTGSTASPGVQTILNYWVDVNHCDKTPVKTPVPNTVPSDNSTAEHWVYGNGRSGVSVEHFKITGGGHQWPIASPGTKNNYGLNNRNFDFNGSLEIWKFLSRYNLKSLDVVNGIEEADALTTVTVYPNPSNGVFTVSVKNYQGAKIKVTDVLGNIVYQSILSSDNTTIDLGNVSGLYIYQVQTRAESISGKIIINR